MDQQQNADTDSRPPAQPVTAPVAPVSPAAEVTKAALSVSDAEAKALLLINNLEASKQSKRKLPLGIIISIVSLIIMAVVVSMLVGSFKSGGNAGSGGSLGGVGLPGQSSPSTGHDVSNNINQDVKTCSNPVNATLVC